MNYIHSAFSVFTITAMLLAPVALFSSNASAKNASSNTTNSTNNKIFAKKQHLREIVPNYQPQTYCSDENKASINYPYYKNILRHDIDCMIATLKPYQKIDTVEKQDTNLNIPYFAYKAQALLNYAANESSENSLTDAEAYALNAGISILEALQQNKTDKLRLTTELPPTSAIMRPDLWATLTSLKNNGAAVIFPRELAYGEVQLIWAAAEYCELGWRHSNEHFGAAQRLIDAAEENFINQHTESDILKLQQDSAAMFLMFKQLDTGDDQCKQSKTISIAKLVG